MLSLPAVTARADDRAAARQHFTAGERHYGQEAWAEALVEYEAAHQAAPLPEFLFNMAQCHRQLGHHAEALDLYQRFLAERPDAPNRRTALDLIDEERAQAASTPAEPAATESAAAPDQEVPPASPGAPPTEAPAEPGRPLLSRIRLPTWLALGGSAVLMGVAGLFAIRAADAESELADPALDCRPRLSYCLDIQDRGDTAAVVRNTFFLLGLAGFAGTAVLATLDLTDETTGERIAWVRPVFSPHGFTLQGAIAWR